MFPHPRLKLRSLMLLIAAIALGCAVIPPWWRWHHEMLRRSEYARRLAVMCTGNAAFFREREAECLEKARVYDKRTPGRIDFAAAARNVAREAAREADGWAARVPVFARSATFPWIDPYAPK